MSKSPKEQHNVAQNTDNTSLKEQPKQCAQCECVSFSANRWKNQYCVNCLHIHTQKSFKIVISQREYEKKLYNKQLSSSSIIQAHKPICIFLYYLKYI